jgi:hypothetical protein
VEWLGRVLHIHYVSGAFYQDTYVVFKNEFYYWNSNAYTLDWIIEDQYTLVLGNPTHVDYGYHLSCGQSTQTGLAYVYVDYAGSSPIAALELPRAPSNYWYQLPTWEDVSPL